MDGAPGELQSDRLRLILDLHRGLSGPVPEGESWVGPLSELRKALDADRVALIARDREGEMVVRSQALETETPNEGAFSQTAIDRVVQSGEALLATDIDDESELGGAESIQRFKIRLLIAIPFGGVAIVGVIYIDGATRRRGHVRGREIVRALSRNRGWGED